MGKRPETKIQHIDFDQNIGQNWFVELEDYTRTFLQRQVDQGERGYFSKGDFDVETINYFLNPEKKNSFIDLLKFLDQVLNKSGIQAASGKHLGYIPGGGLFENAVGDYLSTLSNYYSGVSFASPYAVKMENALINWASNLIGYEREAKGNITSGGSVANLTALFTAKKARGIQSKNIEKQVIYLTSQTHHSINKALKVTGLDEAVIRCLNINQHFEMEVADLERQVKMDQKEGLFPFLVISNAGSTNSGAIDQLDEIATVSAEHHLWHHVDAAYGGAFLLSKQGKKQLSGIERSDSVTIDPHKGLFQSYGVGMVLVKKGDLLFQAFAEDADYMRDVDSEESTASPSNLSIELSRPFRGLRLWMALKLHGIEKYAAALDEKLLLTQYLFRKLKGLNFIIGPPPKLSVVLFRTENDLLTKALIQEIHKEGKVFISSTVIEGEIWLRAAILSHRTSMMEVDQLIEFLTQWLQNKNK